jgi:hypothetical protein
MTGVYWFSGNYLLAAEKQAKIKGAKSNLRAKN